VSLDDVQPACYGHDTGLLASSCFIVPDSAWGWLAHPRVS
jgi:hypothetical protein